MLTLWNSTGDLTRTARGWDDLFERLWGDSLHTPTVVARGFVPSVDVTEREDAFVLTADVPGLKKSEITLSVHDGTLNLSGTRSAEATETKTGHRVRERSYGRFERRFRLGPQVDSEAIDARVENGVLTVVLPKREAAKPRQIEVG